MMKMKGMNYKLSTCVWEITLACCFSCRYCGSRAGKARENELTTEECLDVVRQLAELGCRRVTLIGGEVFMRPDWLQIIEAMTQKGVRVSIITNGFIFPQKTIDELKRVNIEAVGISLDGPEEIHDRFRHEGSFKQAVKAIDLLSSSDILVSVISTLHRENIPYLEDMYEILEGKKIYGWQLQACSPMGNAAEGGMSTEIDFGEVIHFVEKHVESSPFDIGIADNIGYFTETEGYLRGNPSGVACFQGCQAGISGIGIDSVGNVKGCESLYDEKFVEGNLREKSLAEIWNDPNAFAYNRQFTPELLTGKCKACRYGSRCKGGCRSYNYFTHGNLYEAYRCASKN